MANLGLKSITFPNNLTYTIPEVDNTLSVEGAAAEAVAVKEALEGKAPAGYVDGYYYVESNEQFDAVLDDILATMPTQSRKVIDTLHGPNSPFEGGVYTITISHQYDNYVLVSAESYSDGGKSLQKTKQNGVWHDWEWVNPPMILGVEYRTTERWQGRAVYVKAVDFGELPNNDVAFVDFCEAGTVSAIIECKPVLTISTGAVYGGITPEVTACYASTNGNIGIRTNSDARSITGVVFVKYTKS